MLNSSLTSDMQLYLITELTFTPTLHTTKYHVDNVQVHNLLKSNMGDNHRPSISIPRYTQQLCASIKNKYSYYGTTQNTLTPHYKNTFYTLIVSLLITPPNKMSARANIYPSPSTIRGQPPTFPMFKLPYIPEYNYVVLCCQHWYCSLKLSNQDKSAKSTHC